MPISSVKVTNFKGIGESVDIPLKPITLFIGPNSSGKSSCIHALACLSQTIKIVNNTSPLILDDEFANVHLGRFIEVIHSRSYDDQISLGLSLENVPSALRDTKTRVSADVEYNFKVTRRTQGTILESGNIRIGDVSYTINRAAGKSYQVRNLATNNTLDTSLGTSFMIDIMRGLAHARGASKYNDFLPLHSFQRTLTDELGKVCYLGPFRQPPQRLYPTRGATPREVGPMGEATVALLANETIQSQSRKHIAQIAKWLNLLGLARNLRIYRSGSSDLFNVDLGLEDGSRFPLADLGYGLSQVLPVLTQCSFAPQGATLLFEQPEIHLHTVAARGLAGVFIQTAKDKKASVLVETHSPEIFLEFLRRMRAGEHQRKDFVAYRVIRESGASTLPPIEVDDNCDVYDNWEKGISLP